MDKGKGEKKKKNTIRSNFLAKKCVYDFLHWDLGYFCMMPAVRAAILFVFQKHWCQVSVYIELIGYFFLGVDFCPFLVCFFIPDPGSKC
jgi:hypothetical protein